MRVLMTADTVGGVWTYALELAGALRPHGVQVELATMGKPLSDAQWAAARQIPNLNIHESGYKLEWMEDPWEDVQRAGDWLLGLESALRPDLVHLNGYAHGALPWCAPVLMVGHSCVLSWWRAVRDEDAPEGWERYQSEVRHGLHAAGLVAAPTQAMLTALEAHYGPLPPSRVLPNARAAAQFPPGSKEPFVLSAGRLWDAAKNVAALQQAAPRLPWPVYVAGEHDHPDGGTVEAGPVHALGCLPPATLARWLGQAAIYALPARYEPFGLSALEGGLAGCALVLGDIPSLREVWGDAALFAPPGDTDALTDTLNALIADEGQRRQLAARARARAREFTPTRMAGAYLAAYHELEN